MMIDTSLPSTSPAASDSGHYSQNVAQRKLNLRYDYKSKKMCNFTD